MRRSIATVSLSGDLETKLHAAAAAGFDGIELFENDLIASPLPPATVKRRADELGLSIVLYQPFRDLEGVSEELFTRNLRRADLKFNVMEALGTDLMLVCSNVSPDAIDDDALAAAQLYSLAERAHERGIRIAYEALAWGKHVDDYEHSWRIVAAADHPSLGVCLDSFHILSRGSDPRAIGQIPGEKIAFLQLADAPLLRMDVLNWSRHYRALPGQGAFDLPAFLDEVLHAGYRGPLSLEIFNDVFRQADPYRIANDAMRSLLALEESVPGIESDTPRGSSPRDYRFVRLAAAGRTARVLEHLLEDMGFTRMPGPEIWRQHAIEVVLVRDRPLATDGAAAVSAIGVATDNPEAAVARADALLAGSRPINGGYEVGAPDGTAAVFSTMTRGVETSADEGGLTRIDHVALSHDFENFEEAILFYRAVLGLVPQESQELTAPQGLVRSRAVRNREGTVRIALNVPLLGSATYGVQHVAFACDDIFDTARMLNTRGVAALPISPNYYDDLDARLDLGGALIDRLQEFDVLYDRDGQGEFFHFYTPTVGHRLFFEIVQRVGGYDGYGAVNAGTRMAAQYEPRGAADAATPLSGS